MDLFSTGEIENRLPYDGEVYYHGRIVNSREAQYYYDRLMETIEWRNDEAIVFGKLIQTKRKVAWYGDHPYLYTYSNTTKKALPWTPELLALKQKAEELTGTVFNSCLLNLYHDGQEGMAWHSDNEKSLGVNTVIASLSFGAERKFAFKHKNTKAMIALQLEAGSLLVMQGTTQTHWLHRLPPTTKVLRPRVNLTFRTIVDQY
ncbi:alpha-ketoglutarate-dependent dioxygenase AlkB family protein [Flavobacterium cerinum]|uniref:Alpha-ketoglutarate-dependent dioxygenase AlkB n=1 Tax=Flavobacterium cerinum TaxID=2502784 RepID=A0ABY5IR72_9FLAO|nr:alpha-ketoglutarate-dependent dioxygenase AlkB [Flavobacterium cerinum]UUC45295.1 alpha-ketoglutarate-dependent dioxygenase AlkB [Flavobacterium cerinum]